MCDACEQLDHRSIRRGMTNVYLPGDREIVALADAVARDSRLTGLEWRAVRLGFDCAMTQRYYYGKKACTLKEPCVYCQEIRTI